MGETSTLNRNGKKPHKRLVGLHAMHYGFRAGENLFVPSEFAIGFIAQKEPGELEDILDSEVNKILSGKYKREEIPQFYDQVMARDFPGEKFDLDDLRDMAREVYERSSKIIDRGLVLPVNKKNQIATISLKDTVSMRVDTRENRSARHPEHKLTLYDPFVDYSTGPVNFRFEGGTLHLQKNLARDNHWSKGLIHEENFVANLGRHMGKYSMTAQHLDKIMSQDIIRKYNTPIRIVDESISAALIALELELYTERGRVSDMRSSKSKKPVVMPFDFKTHPQYAIEAFIMVHSDLNDKSDMRRRLFRTDMYLTGKKIVSEQFNRLYSQHLVKKEIKIADKSFSVWNGSMIQSFEEHFWEEGRTFEGHALEFVGTPYQSVSIVFDDRVYKDRDLSIRIILDNNTALPYILYKRFVDTPGNNPESILFKDLALHKFKGHPLDYVNYSKQVHDQRYSSVKIKFWYERDPRTGRIARCTIFEPDAQRLQRGSEFASEAGMSISASKLKDQYFENLQSYKRDTRKRS